MRRSFASGSVSEIALITPILRGECGCACAASGHAAAPPTRLMNCPRCILYPVQEQSSDRGWKNNNANARRRSLWGHSRRLTVGERLPVYADQATFAG